MKKNVVIRSGIKAGGNPWDGKVIEITMK